MGWFRGFVISSIGGIGAGLGDNVIRSGYERDRGPVFKPRYVLGMFLSFFLDSFLTIVGLYYAPCVVVAATGAVHIASNALFGKLIMKDSLLWQHTLGLGTIAFGLLFIVLSSPSNGSYGGNLSEYLTKPPVVLLHILYALLLIFAVLLTAKRFDDQLTLEVLEGPLPPRQDVMSRPTGTTPTRLVPSAIRRITISCASGVCGGHILVLLDLLLKTLDSQGLSAIKLWRFNFIFSIIACLAALQIFLLNAALEKYDPPFVLPAANCTLLFVSYLSGVAVMGDTIFQHNGHRAAVFFAYVFLGSGIVILTKADSNREFMELQALGQELDGIEIPGRRRVEEGGREESKKHFINNTEMLDA